MCLVVLSAPRRILFWKKYFLKFPRYFLPYQSRFSSLELYHNCLLQMLPIWIRQHLLLHLHCVIQNQVSIIITKNVNSLPNDISFEWSKLKVFAHDKINKFVLERVKNIVGKGENAGYQHFLLFLQCFQKVSFSR